MNKKILIATLSIASLGITGCSSMMSIGESNYSCPGLPDGSVCQSVIENYEMTNDGFKGSKGRVTSNKNYYLEDVHNAGKLDSPTQSNQIRTSFNIPDVTSSAPIGLEIINNPYVSKKFPKIEQPKVYGVWFAPRVGSDGRFYGERTVYFVNGATQWKDSQNYIPAISGANLSKPKIFKPLQVVKTKRKSKKGDASVTPNMQMPSNVTIFNK